ncbi:MAG: lipooligosaccharide transport system permease protein, partial [Chloroflexota bacterium]|nr:lipooligosaccharide transport system permease protein [Chloroflexota bacterium]
MSALAPPLRAYEFWLMQYRRIWRSSVITSVVNPVFYLGALGIGLGTLVNRSGGQPLG